MDYLEARAILKDMWETYKDSSSPIPLPGQGRFIEACSLVLGSVPGDELVCESIEQYQQIVNRNS